MSTIATQELETRPIVLLRGEIPAILLAFDGARHTLPEAEIPCNERVAEHLTAALAKTWGIDAVSLFSLAPSSSDSGLQQTRYEVMESCCGLLPAMHGQRKWLAADGLLERDFHDPRDYEAVRDGIAQLVAGAGNRSRGAFGRLGWFTDLQQWVQEEIKTQGLHLSGRFRQLTASPTFSLIRFETDGSAVWFKAVGAPNGREYRLTLVLADSVPRFLPQLIATRPEWNGWLSLEAPGNLLSECCGLGWWEAAAAHLAELQIRLLDRSFHLLSHGARDLRTRALAQSVEPFFHTMGKIMERQTKTSPAALSRDELRCLAARVADSLTILDETELPASFGHLDLNPANIVCSPSSGCVFLDFAETFVGHPFLSYEYLREHFRRVFGPNHSQERRLTASYTLPWRTLASESDFRRVLELTPLLAVFAHAVGSDRWTDPRRLQEPLAAGYLRSLTRRMEREARELSHRSLSCTI